MPVYLDASVLLPMIIQEKASTAVDLYMSKVASTVYVSALAMGEVASGLSRLVRMKLLKLTDARDRLADFDLWCTSSTLKMDIEAVDVRLADTFVRRFELGLRMPDAMHAAACLRLDHRLVTLDLRFAKAARELGLSVDVPDDR